jgi:hypothetical protein
MKLIWNRDEGKARINGDAFTITSEVRNELNGRRRLHEKGEVVRTVLNGRWGNPYMPRPFPRGAWNITDIRMSGDPEFAPLKIITDAFQTVEIWSLDENGGYDKPSGETTRDEGYYLHWSEGSMTTLGCGRVGTDTPEQVERLAGIIRNAWEHNESVTLEVV